MVDGLRRLGRGAVYWLTATVGLVALMVGVFLVAETVHNRWFPVHLLLAPLFVLIGLALVIVGSRSSATAVPDRGRRPAIARCMAPVCLVGLGFVGGGFVYGVTANVDAVIYAFAASVAAMFLVSIVVGRRRRQ